MNANVVVLPLVTEPVQFADQAGIAPEGAVLAVTFQLPGSALSGLKVSVCPGPVISMVLGVLGIVLVPLDPEMVEDRNIVDPPGSGKPVIVTLIWPASDCGSTSTSPTQQLAQSQPPSHAPKLIANALTITIVHKRTRIRLLD